jgi:hypothetical protein
VLHLLFRTSSNHVKHWLLWQLEAIVHEAGNDGSITNIDALNVRLENQVRCVSMALHLFKGSFQCRSSIWEPGTLCNHSGSMALHLFKGSFQCRSSVFVFQRHTFPFKLTKLNDYFLLA